MNIEQFYDAMLNEIKEEAWRAACTRQRVADRINSLIRHYREYCQGSESEKMSDWVDSVEPEFVAIFDMAALVVDASKNPCVQAPGASSWKE